MTSGLRKLVLTAHITFSVAWIGAVAAFLALAIAGLTSQDPQMVRADYGAMELTAIATMIGAPTSKGKRVFLHPAILPGSSPPGGCCPRSSTIGDDLMSSRFSRTAVAPEHAGRLF